MKALSVRVSSCNIDIENRKDRKAKNSQRRDHLESVFIKSKLPRIVQVFFVCGTERKKINNGKLYDNDVW